MNTQKTKWNLIDTMIALFLLLAIASAVYFSVPGWGKERQNATTPILYQIEIENLLPEIAAHVQENETVYDATSNVLLGTLQSVSAKPSTYTVLNAQGQVTVLPHPEYLTLTLTILADATILETTVVNGKLIRVGEDFSVKTAHFVGNGRCTHVQAVSSDAA